MTNIINVKRNAVSGLNVQKFRSYISNLPSQENNLRRDHAIISPSQENNSHHLQGCNTLTVRPSKGITVT